MKPKEIAWSLGILTAFVLVRVALLVAREPFYDELFTQWITRQSFGGILESLRHDSGPPLFYFVLKVLSVLSVPSVLAARVFSLACATLSVTILLLAQRLGNTRFAAAALLAVYAPSVLLSTDARAYALCGLFITIGIVAVVYERHVLAAIAFALAAYSHYYGVLFFLALPKLRSIAISVALFIPGFLLAYAQPSAATQWLGRENPLANIAFAGRYPETLFAPSPWWLVAVALLLLAVSLRWNPMTRFVVIPVALAVAFVLLGRPVYFPMRFESVIAIPLCLLLGSDPNKRKGLLLVGQGVIGAYVCVMGIVEHANRPLDDYRQIALYAREQVPAGMPVVATGYLYLETVTTLGDRVRAFPAEQAVHPGWRVAAKRIEPLPQHFLWIGERAAPELRLLCGQRTCRERFGNARAVAVEMQ